MPNLSRSSSASSSPWSPTRVRRLVATVTARSAVGDDRLRHAARARAAEGPLGSAPVAQLLAQPADARLELGLLGRRRTPGRLAVGARGARHVARADACGRQGLPGPPGQRVLRRLRRRDPGLHGRGLVVEPVAALGQTEQRGGVDGRVRAAHDPANVPAAMSQSPWSASVWPRLQQSDRDVSVERARPAGVAVRGRRKGHCPSQEQRGLASPRL